MQANISMYFLSSGALHYDRRIRCLSVFFIIAPLIVRLSRAIVANKTVGVCIKHLDIISNQRNVNYV
jgi:hypothetical protein